MSLNTIEDISTLLRGQHYVAERSLLTAAFVALSLKRPLFLEGEAGVGKTELAKVLASGLGRELIRLQCYEGLDVSSAVYEWNYARQMIEIRLAEAAGDRSRAALADDVFSEQFLIERPLLQAIRGSGKAGSVLLIDELDRADEPFEAFLLELLGEFQITIPEIGVVKAAEPPIVVITSNRTREIHDALKRRCVYHWIDYPSFEREEQILSLKHPNGEPRLVNQLVGFVQKLRELDLFKLPGVAETLDWARALSALGVTELNAEVVDETLGVLLKYQDDIVSVRGATGASILSGLDASGSVPQ